MKAAIVVIKEVMRATWIKEESKTSELKKLKEKKCNIRRQYKNVRPKR